MNVLTPKYTYERNSNSEKDIIFDNLFVHNNSPTLSITPNTKSWVSELIKLPSPQRSSNRNNSIETSEKLITKNKLLKEKLYQCRKLLKQKRTIIYSLKKFNAKNKKIDINQFFKETKFPSVNSKALISMQILHKKRKPWNSAEKKVALSLYYKSPSAYKYLRQNGIILPGECTVRRWLNSIHYSTGFSEKYLEQIKLKISDLTYDEKKCVILLDEVSIMKSVEYNKTLDEIEGFEDLGLIGRTHKLGSNALVIMIRGLYKNWKLPFSYFFTGSGVKGNDLVKIVKESVEKMLDVGFFPSCIVCDQGTQNRRMFSLFGATEDNPFTVISGAKLFLIYDMPHLIKSLRNNLLTGDFKINNKIVSMKDIQKTYEIDTNNTTARAMPKITPAHLNPNPFKKMTCKLAIQLLSNSVSAAIKTCVATGQLKSTSAVYTSEFISDVNKMFDSANSKNLSDPNPNRKPMSIRNKLVFDNLNKARSLFKNAVKECHKTKKISTPPCFTGIIWTITAILELYFSEKTDMNNFQPEKDFFLLTNRLTQDALENFFSIIRQKNGYNRNPTSRTFRCCFSHICSYSLMKCISTCNNCETDDNKFLTVDVLKDVDVNTSNPTADIIKISNIDCDPEKTTDSDSSTQFFENPNSLEATLETCSIIYFGGYLAKKCVEKFNCTSCDLIKPKENLCDEKQLLLIFKTYGHVSASQGLKAPSDNLIKIVTLCLNVFEKKISKIMIEKKVLEQLMLSAKKKINKHSSVLQSTTCKNHYIYIVQLLFRTKIYKECKWINTNIGRKGYQNAAKLRVLENK